MRVLEWPRFLAGEPVVPGGAAAAMTIGVFDGVHRGHRVLIDKITRRGPPYTPVVVTFTRNPREFFRPREWGGDILSLPRKLAVFEELGVAAVLLIDFSANFSRLGGKDFIELLRSRGNLGYLAVGAHFRCGFMLDTDAAALMDITGPAGITTELAAPLRDEAGPISSSRIREAIVRGDLSLAAGLLGRGVELDFSDMAPESREGGTLFCFTGPPRVLPPPGNYRALLEDSVLEDPARRVEADISITAGGVLVPPPFSPRGAEFINRVL